MRRNVKTLDGLYGLLGPVRAAMEHEDNLINLCLNRHEKFLKENALQSRQSQDSHSG